MKILFVYPNIIDFACQLGQYNMGIGYLSAVLKRDGHDVSVFNIYKRISKKEFIERVVNEKPDLIAFSATSHMFPFVRQYCNWLLQEGLRFKTICGGVHATLLPQEVIETKGIDMVCVGEGENALSQLSQKLQSGEDISDINNIWIKTQSDIKKNPVGPLVENLDDLPFPDRNVFNREELRYGTSGRLVMSASRGCPYNCTYCCNHALKGIYPNKQKFLRFRSVENVIAEIKQVFKEQPFFNSVLFHDDILFLNKNWARNFVTLFKKELNVPFSCNSRPEIMDEETVSMLKEAGCFRVCIGVESGKDHISNNVLKRRIKADHIRRAFKLCRSAGIEAYSFNMVGIPHETPRDVMETVKLNSEISSDLFQVTIFYPYVGTQLYDTCKQEKFLTDRRVDDYFKDTCLNLPTMSRVQILMFKRYFVFLVKFYAMLNRLPKGYAKVTMKFLDYFLTRRFTAHCLNSIYHVARSSYRRFLQNTPVEKLIKRIV